MNDSLQYDLSATPAVDRLETIAIRRLQKYEPPEGYYLAFSGGKDSIVILELARRAGVSDGLVCENFGRDGCSDGWWQTYPDGEPV